MQDLEVSAYRMPTDFPESDGTLEWDSVSFVVVEARSGDKRGLGYSPSHPAAATLIRDRLAESVVGREAMAIASIRKELMDDVRNIGRPGVGAMAISAVDVALWDLKARLLDLSLVDLLGAAREGIDIYGSGGFTSYSIGQLQEQLAGWARNGISRVKMKVGRDPERDIERVKAAREAIGPDTELYVDANGAYSRKQALGFAQAFSDLGVLWFEEPVSSDDLEGLRLIRDSAPAGMEIAAGEYGHDSGYFRRMLEAGAVDVLQADATRCGGFSGFLSADTLCDARSMPLSAHTAPSLHAPVCCAAARARHAEFFHDHASIESILFEGALAPEDGMLRPDRSRPGLGMELKRPDAERYAIPF